MTPTAVPDVLNALVALFTEAVGSVVEVVDGYSMQPDDAAQLIVGASDPERQEDPAATAVQSLMPGMGNDREESITVVCFLSDYPTGGMAASRAFLRGVLGECDSALRANRDLDGLVNDAHLGGDFAWYQADGPTGDRIRVAFTVTADAYI